MMKISKSYLATSNYLHKQQKLLEKKIIKMIHEFELLDDFNFVRSINVK